MFIKIDENGIIEMNNRNWCWAFYWNLQKKTKKSIREQSHNRQSNI